MKSANGASARRGGTYVGTESPTAALAVADHSPSQSPNPIPNVVGSVADGQVTWGARVPICGETSAVRRR